MIDCVLVWKTGATFYNKGKLVFVALKNGRLIIGDNVLAFPDLYAAILHGFSVM